MAIGAYVHRVRFQNPGPPAPDGDGGSIETWVDCTPAEWKVSITPATTQDLERAAAGTVISSASHLVAGYFHPQVTTQTRMIFQGQTFAITGKVNIEMRSIDMLCGAVAVEGVP
jgi:head-tail adaptor